MEQKLRHVIREIIKEEIGFAGSITKCIGEVRGVANAIPKSTANYSQILTKSKSVIKLLEALRADIQKSF